jgi:hypothetical protein
MNLSLRSHKKIQSVLYIYLFNELTTYEIDEVIYIFFSNNFIISCVHFFIYKKGKNLQ